MALDLLTYPELMDAQAAVASACAGQAEALRKFRCAPHGERTARMKALQEAVQTALKAELHLAALRAEAA